MEQSGNWSEERVERIVAGLLRFGVMLSAAVVTVGAIAYLFRYGAGVPQYAVFGGEPDWLRAVGGILRGAFSLHSRGIIQFGLLLLIATPVARVAFAVYGFGRERDWKFVVVSSIVLAVLLYSLVFSR